MDKSLENARLAEQMIPKGDDFLSAADITKLTPQIVIENLRKLKPFLAGQAAESEKLRRPTEAAWSAIRRSGYYYLMLPKIEGGLEASYDEMMDATFAICEADASLGWLGAFTVMNPRSVMAFPEQARAELFGGNRFTILTSLLAPWGEAKKVEGGYCVSGLWHWGTTIQVADWVSLSAFVETPELGRTLGAFLVPADQVEPLDTWDAQGLIATGTHKVRANAVFVPEHRATMFSMQTQQWMDKIRNETPYSNPYYCANLRTALALTILVPLVGIARGALELYHQHLLEHTKRNTEGTESNRPISQARLAKVTAMVSSAELMARDCARVIYSNYNKPDDYQTHLSLVERGRIAYAANLAREAVLVMAESAGTSLHYNDHPFARFLRDMLVGSTHVAVDLDINQENAGRALLGLPPIVPPEKRRTA